MKMTEDHGYRPIKGFLTDNLRSSTRFHDPSGFAQAIGFPDQTQGARNTDELDWQVQNAVNVATSYLKIGDATPVSTPSSPTKGRERPTINGTPYERQTRPALITPRSMEGKRILYSIFEYETLLDSANVDLSVWSRMAIDIEINYNLFDAFIILHGTDTMAFTASALSFMLEHLGKPVVITGSQIPLAEVRNDAVENLLGSLTIAGHCLIPEVTLYFGNRLFRGNRTSKQDALDFDAFESPNMDPLVKVGIDINVDWNLVLRPREIQKFRAHKKMEPRVATLKLFPGIAIETLEAFLGGSIRGIVLETFGSGNAPSNRPDLLAAFEKAIQGRGVVIVNTTQCRRGSVSDVYETGKGLTSVGVIQGHDMTPECALVKLSYLLSKGLSQEEVGELLSRNLRGELTPSPKEQAAGDSFALGREGGGFVEEMLSLLHRSPLRPFPQSEPSAELASSIAPLDPVPVAETSHVALERELTPLLVMSCISRNDLRGLEYILERAGARGVVTTFAGGKTGLHLACAGALASIVRCLLSAGASVHARDKDGHTPLFDAIFAISDGTASFAERRNECISMLRETGAHLAGWITVTRTIRRRNYISSEQPVDVAEKLRVGEMRDLLWRAGVAASSGDAALISLLMDCGVDMCKEVLEGRTVLHIACAAPRPDIVRLIAEKQLADSGTLPRDRWDKTPLQNAEEAGKTAQDDEHKAKAMYEECVSILRSLE
jgi:lysophospholipase